MKLALHRNTLRRVTAGVALTVSLGVAFRADLTRAGTAEPKALTKGVLGGISYIINQQHKDGGWGQGGGWRQSSDGGRNEGASLQQEQSDVGNTAIAALALVRAGHTPSSGKNAAAVARGIGYICGQVERSEPKSLWITDVRDTQLQMKIGRYADTFLASLVLAEVNGKMPDAAANTRVEKCLATVLGKIERNQRDDGTFEDNHGWASVLSQGLSTKALNRAKQNGASVSEEALARAQKSADFDAKSGSFRGGGSAASDAGVGIYAGSAGLATLSETVNAGAEVERQARRTMADPAATRGDKEEAKKSMDRVEEARRMERDAKDALVNQISDERFVSGFGSNGGEEYLSYMNISETLVTGGGKEWEDWDQKMTSNLERVQNGDGSWSGEHCITGRTFVTSTALLVLMADRAPVPISTRIKRG